MKKSNNYGMSLLEIVIALAILSLLMVAVLSLISNNTVIFRKTKKDMQMQTQAEEAYNIISDDLKSAKYVYLKGYTDDSGDVKAYTLNGSSSSQKFSSIDGQDLHVTEMIIVYSASLDTGMLDGVAESTYDNGSGCTINYVSFTGTGSSKTVSSPGVSAVDDVNGAISVDADSGIPSLNRTSDMNHVIYKGETDLCLATFKFYNKEAGDQGYISLTKQFLFMDDLDIDDTTDVEKIKICDALESAIININTSNNSVGLELVFDDSNRSFTVKNLVNVKNDGIIREFRGASVEPTTE
ncbi:MAG: type II secretion system protein [Eubacterium sp.]|nr:type II secretion system protein [Eubacterium sp.]